MGIDMASTRDYTYSISSADKTLKLIEILTEGQRNYSVSEIARRLDTHVSSADRFLLTLEGLGYVERDQITGKFRLSDKLIDISNRIVVSHPLTVRYLDTMHTLAYDFDTTTHIMAFWGMKTVTLHKDLQTHNLSFNNAFFDPKRYHYCSGPGKLLLSTLSEEKLAQYFSTVKFIRFTPKTMTSETEVRKNLDLIRNVGYSVHDEEWLPGNLTIAFPLRVHGEIRGALSLMCDIGMKEKMLSESVISLIKERLKEPSEYL